MRKGDTDSICLVLISLLLPASILCLAGIGERVYAALFNAWKFLGSDNVRIDIGVNLSFSALFFCLFGVTISMLVVFAGKYRFGIFVLWSLSFLRL